MPNIFTKLTDQYIKYERHISSVSLLGGFVFTIFTLKRVDEFIENFWVVLHLIIAAMGIIILNIIEQRRLRREIEANDKKSIRGAITTESRETSRVHFWVILLIQFAFGGILSTFIVFYFRSATLEASWPFMLMLALVFIANEILKKHYTRLTFQITVLFLSIYCFMIFLIPVILRRIGADVFVLSGLLSIVLILLFLFVLRLITREQFKRKRGMLYGSLFTLYVVMNVLYFTNIIPPIPLALKDAGVYHSVERINDKQGLYKVSYEKQPWTEFFRRYEPYHHVAGDAVYVFSAIFSPAKFNLPIVHKWQLYNEKIQKWQTQSTINIEIVGGRENGFRTYSRKTGVVPGKWRVDVETSAGQKIGRIKFEVIRAETEPVLVEETK